LLLDRTYPVEIVALNSSSLAQTPKLFQGQGFVGNRQLAEAAKGMDWAGKPPADRAFRILMLHHHLVPVAYSEDPVVGGTYSLALDANAIIRWAVENRVDLVLHGHMHRPFRVRLDVPVNDDEQAGASLMPLWVVGMGSSGVESKYIEGPQKANTFGLLRFHNGSLNVSVYEINTKERRSGKAAVFSVDIPLSSESRRL
jgi:3',5'-cyclic AMP phosphodiesterase CpdA